MSADSSVFMHSAKCSLAEIKRRKKYEWRDKNHNANIPRALDIFWPRTFVRPFFWQHLFLSSVKPTTSITWNREETISVKKGLGS